MTVTYYWYDHLFLRTNGDAEKVQKAIKEHDFETFMFYYDKYQTNRKDDLIFFFFFLIFGKMMIVLGNFVF